MVLNFTAASLSSSFKIDGSSKPRRGGLVVLDSPESR